jgi:hypothetical protein
MALEVRRRRDHGESIESILSRLEGEARVLPREAANVLVEVCALSRTAAEHAISRHRDWAPLIRLMGGIDGTRLSDDPTFVE